MMDRNPAINKMAYAMTERPRCFYVKGKPFFLNPATLGMVQVCTPLLRDLSVDQELATLSAEGEILRVCNDDRMKVCVLIAYRTCRTKEEIYNEPRIQKLANYLNSYMPLSDMASILIYIINEIQSSVDDIEEALGITDERRWLSRAIETKMKNDDHGGSLTFGGRSIYGSLIGHFCKEYGWTFQYVMWGISLVNLKLLHDDEVTTISLSKEELRISGVPTDRSAAMMNYRDAVAKYANAFDNA